MRFWKRGYDLLSTLNMDSFPFVNIYNTIKYNITSRYMIGFLDTSKPPHD